MKFRINKFYSPSSLKGLLLCDTETTPPGVSKITTANSAIQANHRVPNSSTSGICT